MKEGRNDRHHISTFIPLGIAPLWPGPQKHVLSSHEETDLTQPYPAEVYGGQVWVSAIITGQQAAPSCFEPHSSLTKWSTLSGGYVEAPSKFDTRIPRCHRHLWVRWTNTQTHFTAWNVFVRVLKLLWPQTWPFLMDLSGNTILWREEVEEGKCLDVSKQLKAHLSSWNILSFSIMP